MQKIMLAINVFHFSGFIESQQKKKIKREDLFFTVGLNASFEGEIHVVVVITTVQIHSTKPEVRFCPDSNPDCGVSEIRDGEDL